MNDFDKEASQAADAIGVTPYSDMRIFVEQAVKYALRNYTSELVKRNAELEWIVTNEIAVAQAEIESRKVMESALNEVVDVAERYMDYDDDSRFGIAIEKCNKALCFKIIN